MKIEMKSQLYEITNSKGETVASVAVAPGSQSVLVMFQKSSPMAKYDMVTLIEEIKSVVPDNFSIAFMPHKLMS